MNRCKWCNINNSRYVEYHDNEWGRARFDDIYLFEMLTLEMFQAGLSWECILNKRDAFRIAYSNFDFNIVSKYDENMIEKLATDSGIIRNRKKIQASINNAKIFKQIVLQYGCFYNYLKIFTGGNIFYETGCTANKIPDAVSSDLKCYGMRFIGSTVIYAYLQAIGIIYSHEPDCFLYKRQ